MHSIINNLKANKNLSREELLSIVNDLREKSLSDSQIKELIIAWREKGERPEELLELQNIIYELQPTIELKANSPIVDVCGTGGDKQNTFNISTLTAFVASASGINIIKHSGRSSTSVSGSVDILEQLGVSIDAENKEEIFNDTGLMFVASKLLREAFVDVKRIGKEIDIPSFVNLTGPIINPYSTDCQLLGVSRPEWGETLSKALYLSGKKRALVISCEIEPGVYLDELSFCGNNHIWNVKEGTVRKETLSPEIFKTKRTSIEELKIKDKAHSKIVFESVLKGSPDESPKVKTVALNAGAAIYLGGKAKSLLEGYEIALKNIQEGKIWEHFNFFLNSINRV